METKQEGTSCAMETKQEDARCAMETKQEDTSCAKETKEGEVLHLSHIRSTLIRMEETIIFALIERAQFRSNEKIYKEGAFDVDGCLLDHLLRRREQIDSQVGRFTSQDENAFFSDDLPSPSEQLLKFPCVIEPNAINLNAKIHATYLDIVPKLCETGDDSNCYGSAAVCDIAVLQALSKRIHYGKFVAESKFRSKQEDYTTLIQADDSGGIMKLLTNAVVEAKILERVRRKARAYGSDWQDDSDVHTLSGKSKSECALKVNPDMIVALYKNFIIPLTKEVEVMYLLRRLE